MAKKSAAATAARARRAKHDEAAEQDKLAQKRMKLQQIGDRIGDHFGDDLVLTFDHLRAKQADALQAPTLYHWELGRSLRDVTRREAEITGKKEEVAAGHGYKALTTALGIRSETTTKNALNIFDAYPTEPEVQRVMGLLREDGIGLSWTVISAIAQPRNPNGTPRSAVEREKLLQRACAENWGAAEVRHLLGGGRFGVNKGADLGGRRPQVPKNLFKALPKWIRMTRTLQTYGDAIFRPEVTETIVKGTDLAALDPAVTLRDCETLDEQIAAVAAMLERMKEANTRIRAVVTAEAVDIRGQSAPVAAPADPPAAAAPGHAGDGPSARDRIGRAKAKAGKVRAGKARLVGAGR
jgi:hypothetical protein